MSPSSRHRDRQGIVYSTDSQHNYEYERADEPTTLPPAQQQLSVALDRKGRGGKQVTLVTGFVGKAEDLSQLSKVLKSFCGTGGAAKEGQIVIQGDFRDKIVQKLEKEGYRTKRR